MPTLMRPPQSRASFVPGDPHSGYYIDLRSKAVERGASPADALAHLETLTAERARANPVTISQLGLGAWQCTQTDPTWREVVSAVASWLVPELESDGAIAYFFPIGHTYRLEPPWYSALAQAEAASLLIRAARTLAAPELLEAALHAASSLVDGTHGLVAETEAGPVLQEYPTDPPAHVLNGWIVSLWGLYDVGAETSADARFREAFDTGVRALAARLPLYRLALGWSRYDLFPHPLANVASPFYHRFHVAQLEATYELTRLEPLCSTLVEWRSAARSPLALGLGVSRKVAFRLIRPRRGFLRAA